MTRETNRQSVAATMHLPGKTKQMQAAVATAKAQGIVMAGGFNGISAPWATPWNNANTGHQRRADRQRYLPGPKAENRPAPPPSNDTRLYRWHWTGQAFARLPPASITPTKSTGKTSAPSAQLRTPEPHRQHWPRRGSRPNNGCPSPLTNHSCSHCPDAPIGSRGWRARPQQTFNRLDNPCLLKTPFDFSVFRQLL